MVTPPRTKKLFISYHSSDAAKVDKIAHDLGLLKYDDGTARYKTWQDKLNLPPASPNWWDAIVDAIIDCDVFVFNMSKASLQSEVCLAELNYAHKRNRPIVPIVLEGEFFLDSKSGKYNISYWEFVPDWLQIVQFLFHVGANLYNDFQTATELFERNWSRDIKVKRPINPNIKGVFSSSHSIYEAACDYAGRLAFSEAEKLFNSLRNDSDYREIVFLWLETLGFYSELIEVYSGRNSRILFNNKLKDYLKLFPNFVFESEIFDPLNFSNDKTFDDVIGKDLPKDNENLYPDSPQSLDENHTTSEREFFSNDTDSSKDVTNISNFDDLTEIHGIGEKTASILVDAGIDTFLKLSELDTEVIANLIRERGGTSYNNIATWAHQAKSYLENQSNQSSDLQPLAVSAITSKPNAVTVLSSTFEWIEISTMKFSIAKYPITNAQFRKFIEAGGYETEKWWPRIAWLTRSAGYILSHDVRDFITNQSDDHPIVNVTWYEAVAFCLWLSDITHEEIMLPTEQQWQYAAQGDDGRFYPWGNNWDENR